MNDLSCLQGPATDPKATARLKHAIEAREPICVGTVIHYDRKRQPFSHSVSVEPIRAEGGTVDVLRLVSSGIARLHVAPQAIASVDLLDGWDDFDADGLEAVDTTASTLVALTMHTRLGHAVQQASGYWSPKSLPPLHPQPPAGPSQYIVLMKAQPPFDVLWASQPWLELCGFQPAEVIGGDLKLIQGPGTDRSAICRMMAAVRSRKSCVVDLINYDKARRPFRHTVHSVYVPAGAEGNEEAIFRAVSTDVSRSSSGIFLRAPDAMAADATADPVHHHPRAVHAPLLRGAHVAALSLSLRSNHQSLSPLHRGGQSVGSAPSPGGSFDLEYGCRSGDYASWMPPWQQAAPTPRAPGWAGFWASDPQAEHRSALVGAGGR